MVIRINILTFFLLATILFGCKKNEEGISINRFGIDPVADKDALNKVLQLEGHYYDSIIPGKRLLLNNVDYAPDTNYGAFFVLENDNRVFRPGDEVSIPFSIFIKYPGAGTLQLDNTQQLSTLKINTAFLKVKGAKGFWKMPLQANGLRYFINFKIPSYIKEGNFTFDFTVNITGKIKVNNVDQTVDAIPEVRTIENVKLYSCNDSISDKGSGLHFYNLDLGNKAGKVTIRCRLTDAYSRFSGDRVDVKYNNKYVATTNPSGELLPFDKYPTCKPGPEQGPGFLDTWLLPGNYKDLSFDYNPSISTNVKVQIYGSCNDGNTGFYFVIKCPN
jgi:hypothetical protein